MKKLIEWAENNLGALDFLCRVFMSDEVDLEGAVTIQSKIEACEKLRGWKLYVLYNDLCNREMKKVIALCRYCPDDVLEDACSRQDRSGKELIENYK